MSAAEANLQRRQLELTLDWTCESCMTVDNPPSDPRCRVCSAWRSDGHREAFEAEQARKEAEMVANAARPKPNVLIVKMGAMSPFAGARAENLRRMVIDIGVADSTTQLVFLIDSTSFEKEGVSATQALPPVYAPLIVPYTKTAVDATFPTLPVPSTSKKGKPMVR